MVLNEIRDFFVPQKSAVHTSLETQYSPNHIKQFENIGRQLGHADFGQDGVVGPVWKVNRTVTHKGEEYPTETLIYPQFGNTQNDNTVEFWRKLKSLPDNALAIECVHEMNANSGLKYVPRDEGVRGKLSLYQHSSQPLEFMNSRQKYFNELDAHDAGEVRVKPVIEKLWEISSCNTLVENRVIARQLMSQ